MKTLRLFITLSMLAVAASSTAAQPAMGVAADAASTPASAPKAATVKKSAARPKDPAKPAVADAVSAAPAGNVELDTTQITGNRELPRVLYVVPWKRADLGELSGKPTKSLLDEVLAPVDRDVFQRQNRYHDALQPDAAAPGTTATTGVAVEPKVEK